MGGWKDIAWTFPCCVCSGARSELDDQYSRAVYVLHVRLLPVLKSLTEKGGAEKASRKESNKVFKAIKRGGGVG